MNQAQDRRVALVTGANKGIGLETARQLGRLGMTVLVGARNVTAGEAAARLLREEGLDARYVQLEVTEAASVAAAARWIEAELGRLDVLVNNAAIAQGMAPPSETDLDVVRRTFEVNVVGVIAVTNAMLPLLRKASPPACIVNVSSGLGSLTLHSDPSWEYASLTSIEYPIAGSGPSPRTGRWPGSTIEVVTLGEGQSTESGPAGGQEVFDLGGKSARSDGSPARRLAVAKKPKVSSIEN